MTGIPCRLVRGLIGVLSVWMLVPGGHPSIRAYVVGRDKIELREVSEKDLASAVEITFLGNCGFLISAGSTHILFDAVHRQADYPQYSTSDDAFRKMLDKEAPFERIDLMLVSHDHPDHVTADMAFQVLSHHPETTLVANDRALSGIRERNAAAYEKAADRIVSVTPEPASLKAVSVQGLSFKVFTQIHDPHTEELVSAYLLDLNGIRILLHADSDLDRNAADLAKLGLEDENVDLWFFTDRPHAALDKVMTTIIKPKSYVIMHNPISDARKYEATVKVYPHAIGFIAPMEKKIFIKKEEETSR
jgi:L-ascorbate metabolism protein UlaG (beta-lactamase superfamily)